MLYNLAALYWRVVGHGPNGVECVRRALYFVPKQYRDVPLLNLANILYRSGHVHDAISVASEALSINDVEVPVPLHVCLMGNFLWYYRYGVQDNTIEKNSVHLLRIHNALVAISK